VDLTLELPRSVLLALWLSDPAADRKVLADAVQSDDEPHTVQRRPAQDDPPRDDVADEPLGALLDLCAGSPRDVAAVLPVPGDPGATPSTVSSAATEAGEAVLVRTPQQCLVAVPVVRRFGSTLEPGHLVTWELSDVPDWRHAVHAQTGSLQDAERELRQGLLQATEALVRLDVARWRPDAAETAARVASATARSDTFGTGYGSVATTSAPWAVSWSRE
jgi:hypothetical protein